MKAGYGARGVTAHVRGTLSLIAPPAGGASNDLAKAAIVAVAKLAAADGHPVSGVPGVPGLLSGGGITATTIILIILIIAALATGGALAAVTLRRPRPAEHRETYRPAARPPVWEPGALRPGPAKRRIERVMDRSRQAARGAPLGYGRRGGLR